MGVFGGIWLRQPHQGRRVMPGGRLVHASGEGFCHSFHLSAEQMERSAQCRPRKMAGA
jgi:hypothetical protein